MPLRLIPPGTRKGNRVYLVRGTLAGRRYEISTETADETAALAFKAGLELEILDRRVPQPGEALSFGQAIELYRDFRDPAKADSGRLDRLKAGMGDRPLAEIRHAFLVDHANRVMPGRAAATRNREIMRPAAAVLHHAARNGYCAWLRIELFKERRPATRAVSVDVARALIAAAPEGPRRLFLLWVFRQGMRISDTLKVRRERIDLAARTVTYHVGKADRPDVVPSMTRSGKPSSTKATTRPSAGRCFPGPRAAASINGYDRSPSGSASHSRRTWRATPSVKSSTTRAKASAPSWTCSITPTSSRARAISRPTSKCCARPGGVSASWDARPPDRQIKADEKIKISALKHSSCDAVALAEFILKLYS